MILGTSGGLDNARGFFSQGTFICVNGKIITDIDLQAAIATHRRQNALATLVLKRNTGRERFSVVETGDGLVTRFAGMPQPTDVGSEADAPLMFTGIHILEPRIFEYIPRDVFSDSVVHVYPQAMAKGERIAAHVGEGMWHELSTLQRYLGISLDLLAAQSRNVFAGDSSQVAASAKIRDAILWNDVEVENDAIVTRSVIGDGVRVRAHEAFEDSVVVRAELVHDTMAPPKALKGRFQDDKFVVPLSQ